MIFLVISNTLLYNISVGACVLMTLDSEMTPEKAIEKMKELRGPRAVQTVKVYCFCVHLHAGNFSVARLCLHKWKWDKHNDV